MEKVKMQTKDLIQENIETIKALFPEVVTEGKDSKGKFREVIDFEHLREILGDDISTSTEHYEFTWVGKREARRLAATPINKTLRPCEEESKDWNSTENLYIEGDNLDVLKLLQESYLGKVKMIYIDPPYNTGKDFVYRDNFHQSQEDWKEQTTLVDEDNNRLAVNPNSAGRFHSDWCTMMYPRLRLAKNLLRDDGVIFMSIDDNEYDNLKKLSDEIFGEMNYVGTVIWERAFSPKNDAKYLSASHDYILIFAKQLDFFKIGMLKRSEESNARYKNLDNDPRGVWISDNLTVKTYSASYDYPIITPSGREVKASSGSCWRVSQKRLQELISDNRIWFGADGNNVPRLKRFLSEVKDGMTPTTLWFHKEVGHNQEGRQELKKIFDGKGYFDGPKPIRLLSRVLQVANVEQDDIILDFFSGSATTAHSVMQLNAEDGGNRKFIMVQVPEKCDEKSEAFKDGYPTICEIGKERIRRAGEKIRKEVEEVNTQLDLGAEPKKIPDIGFRVLKIDSSNMNDVYYGAAELEQKDLFDSESNIKGDRTELDILFGVMLDWGLPLSLPYKKEMISDTVIHNVEDGALVACFADSISEEVIIALAKKQATKIVFKDSCFSSSVDRINVEQLFKHYDPTFASNPGKIRVV